MTETSTRQVWQVLKVVLAVVSLVIIYQMTASRTDFRQSVEALFQQMESKRWVSAFCVLMLMMGANWMLEIMKWKYLMAPIRPLTWFAATAGVLSGITISLLAPNRTGEFAGRAAHAEYGYRIRAAIASITGSMNQFLTTLIAGAVALAFTPVPAGFSHAEWWYSAKWIIGIAAILCTVAYFNLSALPLLLRRWIRKGQIKIYISVFGVYRFKDLLAIGMFSAGRYLLFSLQFLMLLNWFGVDLAPGEGLRLIALIYLVMSVVPTFAISELTVRGSVALYFLSSFTGNATLILAATTLLWLINLVIPALAGALSFLWLNFKNSEPG